MKIDPRTKLLILAITSISVFLNGSITIECIFAALLFYCCSVQRRFIRL